MSKKLVAATVLLTLTLSTALTLSGAPNIRLLVNHREIVSDVAPQNLNNRVLVPTRVIAEALGANVNWVEATQTVEVTMPDQFRRWDSLLNEGEYGNSFTTKAIHHVNSRYVLLEQRSAVYGETVFWLWDAETNQKQLVLNDLAKLEAINEQQILFTVKGETASGNMFFPYRLIYDLGSKETKQDALYLGQDVAFGNASSWPHDFKEAVVGERDIRLSFAVAKGAVRAGGHRVPLTNVDYAGKELTLRVYGVAAASPTLLTFEHPMISSIECTPLSADEPVTNLELLRSDIPFGNRLTADARISQTSVQIKIKFAEEIKFNIATDGSEDMVYTISYVKE
ncbi:MAG: copper amine oxidase N-terminal domain-containing protein [Bacillota bacterium]